MRATAKTEFLANYINSGLIHLIIMDSRIVVGFFSFQMNNYINGTYEDFNVLWYNKIGSAICVTMFLNIFTPHLSNILMLMYIKFARWKDRCTIKKHSVINNKNF
jgi:hypothetical protein